MPDGFRDPRVCLPGVLAVTSPPCGRPRGGDDPDAERFCKFYGRVDAINAFPLVLRVDDSEFTARTVNNFLWVTFTRSDPAADIDGVGAFVDRKHWGCVGPLVIDARIKPHHAPPLEDDPGVERRVDELGAPGGSLHGMI